MNTPNKFFKLNVIGHACLYIETKDVRLLVDPWIVGSCYWRSWWNYPEVEEPLIKDINPTHIYLTHLHWDHYHGPTLRKFYGSDPVIILPKAVTKRMKDDMVRDFKFSRVVIWNKEVLISPALLTNILILSNSVTIFFATFLVSSSLEKLKE